MRGDIVDPVIGTPGKKGQPGQMGSLRIQGPYVARRVNGKVERLYPMPLDVLYRPEQAKQPAETRLLKPASKTEFVTNAPFGGWRPLEGGGERFKEASAYLSGKAPAVAHIVPAGALYSYEDRVGLGIDFTRRANKIGHFYRAQFVRMEAGVGLLAGLDGGELDRQGVIHIGGEARTGCYETVSLAAMPSPRPGNLKVALLAPAWFEDIYRTDWSAWVGQGRLVSVVLGKAQPISGWDVARNTPKPMRNCIPMGSVFFFENATWQGGAFTASPQHEPDFSAMGFGTCAAANW
jgi:CRISPR-associated protein Cmr3